MDSASNKELHISVTENNNSATIFLNGHFAFHAHHNFHDACVLLLKKSAIHDIVIDLADVNYLDSSALGMLLLLLDSVRALNKSLTLSKPNSMVAAVFDIANFHKMFSIQ